jgi:hypothetical protein
MCFAMARPAGYGSVNGQKAQRQPFVLDWRLFVKFTSLPDPAM